MSHLPTERLAALVDETPTSVELAHLASCTDCARERAAYRNLTELAANSAKSIGAPLTSWDSLAPMLAADGVIDRGQVSPVRKRDARVVRRVWLQAAAAVLLLAGGLVGGRLSTSVWPSGALASSADSVPEFKSIEDARVAQTRSQVLYQSATAFLAQNDTLSIDSPSAMRARLAALDRAQDVMGEALDQAPYDPVINGYYLTTVGQREATIRQLNTVLPTNMRMTSY